MCTVKVDEKNQNCQRIMKRTKPKCLMRTWMRVDASVSYGHATRHDLNVFKTQIDFIFSAAGHVLQRISNHIKKNPKNTYI